MTRFLQRAGLVLCMVLGLSWHVQAVTVFWDDGASPDHSLVTPANWLNDTYPLPEDYGVIQSGYIAEVNSDAPGITRLYVGDDQFDIGAPAAGAGTLNVVTGGTLTLSGNLIISDADPAFPVLGTVNISGGSLTTYNQVLVGNAANSVGVINQTGGSLIAAKTTGDPPTTTKYLMRLGFGVGSYGLYRVSGEAIADMNGIFPGYDSGAVGVVEQSGGTITLTGSGGGLRVGTGKNTTSPGTGLFHQTGGTISTEVLFSVGGGYVNCWGQANIGGTTVVAPAAYTAVARHSGGGAKGYLNLQTGGTLTTAYVAAFATEASGGEAFLAFHGGTLKANASTSDPADPATHFTRWSAAPGGVFIGAEGGTIDTGASDDGLTNYDIVISDPLQPLVGQGLSGFTFTGGAGYAGPPIVKIEQLDANTNGQRGWGASAVATVVGGSVTAITVTNPGTGYDPEDPVTVTLVGGAPTVGSEAAVTAVTLAANTADGGLTKKGLGRLTLAGANTYAGLTNVQAGTLSVTGSVAGSVSVADGATLLGTGTIGGNVVAASGGNVEAGTSAGTLTVNGGVNLSAGANMTWELAALSEANPGTDFDLLSVLANVTLGGTSQLTLDFDLLAEADRPGYATPNAFWNTDHSWKIIDAVTTTGDFAALVNYAFTAGSFDTSVVGNDVFLDYTHGAPLPPIPGDTDDNRIVNELDAQKVAQNWGANVGLGGFAQGDFNGDQLVNAADAAIMAANWGSHASESAAGVPEPSAIAVLLAGLASLAIVRRRR